MEALAAAGEGSQPRPPRPVAGLAYIAIAVAALAAGASLVMRRAGTLCDIVEGKEGFPATSMCGRQGQATQIRQRLTRAFMINS